MLIWWALRGPFKDITELERVKCFHEGRRGRTKRFERRWDSYSAAEKK